MTAKRNPKPRKTRAEKAAQTRAALLRAAADVIGEVGYRDASIARITERAGVAQGTFYLYFENQQDLFDQLLPTLGQDLLENLSERVAGTKDILEVEEAGFRGFFDYLTDHPAFFRILNEAEIAAPRAYERHFGLLRRHYLRALERSWKKGELPDFEQRELEVLVYILMAARSYLYLRYSKSEAGPQPMPEWVVQAFMKFVRGGVLQGRPDLTAPSSRPEKE